VDLAPTKPVDATNSSRRNATFISVFIIIFSAALAYSNSFNGPFVFDDVPTIVNSPSIRQLWPIWPVLFMAGVSAIGRPLVNLSFALNYAYGGLNVTSYHIVNIFIHVVAGLAFFGVVRRTLERSAASIQLNEHATQIALFCSLIWTLHPLQTESVTYVVQRSESLGGLFYLLTLYCAIRADSSRRSTVWATVSFLACLCGVASKETIVSAPLAVIVYDWAFSGCTIHSLLQRRRWLYASLFSTWIPLMFLVFLGRWGSAGFGYGLSSWEYSMTQFGAIVGYLRLCIWPDSLVLDYGAGVTRNANEIAPAAIIVGLLACGSIVAIKYQRWIAFLGFVFFAALSPSSSFIPLVTQTIAEHRMYLSLASVVVLAVVVIWQTCRSIVRKWYPKISSSRFEWLVPGFVLSLIAICFGTMTFSRNFEYGDAIRT